MTRDPDDMNPAVEKARQEVINAVLYRAYTQEQCGGRETANDSFNFDHGEDRLDEAFAAYNKAVLANTAHNSLGLNSQESTP